MSGMKGFRWDGDSLWAGRCKVAEIGRVRGGWEARQRLGGTTLCASAERARAVAEGEARRDIESMAAAIAAAPPEVTQRERVRTTFDAQVLTIDATGEVPFVELLPRGEAHVLRVPVSIDQLREVGAHLYSDVRVTVIVEPVEVTE